MVAITMAFRLAGFQLACGCRNEKLPGTREDFPVLLRLRKPHSNERARNLVQLFRLKGTAHARGACPKGQCYKTSTGPGWNQRVWISRRLSGPLPPTHH